MIRSTAKHSFAKPIILLLAFVALLAISLTRDFHSASSSAYVSLATTWAPDKYRINVSNHSLKNQDAGGSNRDRYPERALAMTYADLPAPELKWEQMASAPVVRLDGYSLQIKDLLFVFAGYENLDHVHSHVDVYNFTTNTWTESFAIPKDMANSHLGVATDGRYIYIVSRQYGPQCRGPTANTFVLDTHQKMGKLATITSTKVCTCNSALERQATCDGGRQRESPHPWIRSLESCSSKWKSLREALA